MKATSRAVVVIALVSVGAAQLARSDDESFPVDIMVIVAKAQAGMSLTPDETKRLDEYVLRHRDEPVNGVTFGDVVAIIATARETGKRPPAAEVAKMRRWAAGMKARAKELRGDAQKLARDLERSAQGNRGGGKGPARGVHAGRVHFRVEQIVDGDGKKNSRTLSDHTTARFDASFPARFDVEDAGDLKITWSLDTFEKKPAHGRLSLERSHSKSGPSFLETSSTHGSERRSATPEEGATTAGVLVLPKGGARPYLDVAAALAGAPCDFKEHIRTTNGSHETTRVEPCPLPLAPLEAMSFDDKGGSGPLWLPTVPEAVRQQATAKLPECVRKAEETASCVFDVASFRKQWAGREPFRSTITYCYTLTRPADPRADNEVVHVESRTIVDLDFGPSDEILEIAPEQELAYASWIPVPYTKDEKIAKAFKVKPEDESLFLTFVVTLRPVKGTEARKRKIELSLRNVSQNAGICTNYPPRDAAVAPGLFFPPDKQEKGVIVDDTTCLTAVTDGAVSSVKIRVAARDSGAFGELVASCPDLPSTECVFTRTKDSFAPIPLDDNGNHVAVAWGGKGRSATDDTDSKPDKQRCDGDGYTLYEEYRGFIVLADPHDKDSWVHIRTDPDVKDVFCWDQSFLVAKYYMPYNPAKLAFHFVDDQLMRTGKPPADPDHRWINVNTPPELFYARQYGMLVLDDPNVADETEAGTTNMIPGYLGLHWDQPLRSQFECRLNKKSVNFQFDRLKDNANWKDADGPARLEQCKENSWTNTVIHEIGHYLGMSHHLPPGKSIYLKPDGHDESPETEDSKKWGVLKCAMRYDNGPTDVAPVLQGKLYPARVEYCTKDDTGVAPGGKTTQDSDDCFGKIKVRCDP